MANLPRKLTFGSSFKELTVRTINSIIDYLYSLRLVGDNQTVSITKKKNGITISAKPSPPTKAPSAAAGETTVDIGDGAAVPARMAQTVANSWLFPYLIYVYPNGYGDNNARVAANALPLTVAYTTPPPNNEPIIAFSTYITELGGQRLGLNQK